MQTEIIAFILIISSLFPLYSADIEHEKTDSRVLLNILFPMNEIISDNSVNKEIKVKITSGKQVIYQNKKKIIFSDENLAEIINSYLVFDLKGELPEGEYTILTEIKDLASRKKKKEIKIIKISAPRKTLSKPKITYYRDNFSFTGCVGGENFRIDSLKIQQLFNPPPLKFEVNADGENLSLKPGKEIRFVLNKKFDKIPNITFNINNKTGRAEEIEILNSKYTDEQKLEQLKNAFPSNETEILYYEGGTAREKINLFWELKSGANNEIKREIEKEFDEKALYVDKKFSIRGYKAGWKTDRGKVYLRYGEPSEITENTHPATGKPYIIWFYYSDGKKYIFKEKSGGGEYELSNTDLD
ncbi:MAG: hypothetical protein CSB55_03650 [Candidatus Cloacimonadota bacterium]|nr:MAG: hypothetical protein CSB55_03650 [Candidatus Cloacimonadota bacterium]